MNKNQNKYSSNVENEQGREDINYTRMDAVSFVYVEKLEINYVEHQSVESNSSMQA